jgi:hypothetical protein
VADTNPQPDAEPTADLEAQIDALAAEATGAGGAPAMSDEASVPAAAGVEPAAAGDGADLVGDALAQQIQQLLDDAQAHSGQTATAPKPAAAPTGAADARASAPAAAAATAADEVDANAAAELDSHLALEADKTIAGEFETVQEVMSAAQKPAGPAAEAPAVPVPAEAAKIAPAAPAPPAAEPAAAAPAPAPAVAEPAKIAPAPAPAPASVAATTGATAQDVAHELDAQPAASAPAAGAPPAAAAKAASAKPARAAAAAVPAAASAPPRTALWPQIDRSLRRFFAVFNGPLLGVGPGVRQALGLIALVTVFNATCLLVYVTVIKGRSAPPAAVSAAEGPGGAPASGSGAPAR